MALKNPLGPVGETVQANVKRLREAQNLTLAELSRRLAKVGRPIPTLGLSRIENGERRVDADDLVALAMALNVSPATLMLPPKDPGGPVLSAGEDWQPMSWQRAWRWMHGSVPLQESKEEDLGELVMWLTTNQPYLNRSELLRRYQAVGRSPAEEAWSWTGPEIERGDEDDGQD